jgi:hypothetical protein
VRVGGESSAGMEGQSAWGNWQRRRKGSGRFEEEMSWVSYCCFGGFLAHRDEGWLGFARRKSFLCFLFSLHNKSTATSVNCWVVKLINIDRNYNQCLMGLLLIVISALGLPLTVISTLSERGWLVYNIWTTTAIVKDMHRIEATALGKHKSMSSAIWM